MLWGRYLIFKSLNHYGLGSSSHYSWWPAPAGKNPREAMYPYKKHLGPQGLHVWVLKVPHV